MQKFIDSLLFLQDKYNISFTIKDFLNCIYTSPSGHLLKKSFHTHDNNYCKLIKQNHEAFLHCVENSKFRLYQKIVSMENPEEGFFGTCYCGVREFVIPLKYQGNVVGALLAGPFSTDINRKASTFERISRIYGYDISSLEYNYNKYIHEDFDVELGLLSLIRICVKYFNEILAEYDDIPNYNLHSRQHSILNNATLYIRSNISKKISILNIAQHCYCSESTLSHLFKQTFEIGVSEYIYSLRISKAKRALQYTDKSLSVITERCGFGSRSHFSNAFKNATGMTALEYRSKYNNQ